jgi:hypothetical protein
MTNLIKNKKVIIGLILIGISFNYMAQEDMVSRFEDRLNLTDEQSIEFEPIIHEHMEKILEVIMKHGINPDQTVLREQINFRLLRTIKSEMDEINSQTEQKLYDMLTKEQFNEFKKVQGELRSEMINNLRNGKTWWR